MNIAAESGLISGNLPEIRYPAVVVGIGVEATDGDKSPSPVSEFIADEEAASICPLLTPSPPTDFQHPLSLINPPPGMAYERQISPSSTDPELSALPMNGNAGYGGLNVNGLVPRDDPDCHVNDSSEKPFNPTSSVQSMMESSSSSSSVLQEPTACATLLNNHHYQHLTKASDTDLFNMQENGGKPQLAGIQLAVCKSTEDYCFLDWNWPVIRKVSFWTVVSLLTGCMCIVVTLVAQLPATCNPSHSWWQGTLFYEIFPASYQDSNKDGLGDFQGLSVRATYLKSLHVRAIRLNSIFMSEHYPDHYYQVLNLTEIHPSLGTLKDFHSVVKAMHKQNISIILDLPINTFIKQLTETEEPDKMYQAHRRDNRVLVDEEFIESNKSDTNSKTLIIGGDVKAENIVTQALNYWLRNGVDGFYIKGLEHLVENNNFASYIREWRRVLDRFSHGDDGEKILMCSIEVLNALDPDLDTEKMNAVLHRMDLIDVYLDLFGNGTTSIKHHIDSLIESLMYKKPGYPWIHWHIGSVDTKRLSSYTQSAEGNLAALLFNMMLPGTPSIFYGDEIGLLDYTGEHSEGSHYPQLVPMHWNSMDNPRGRGFTPIEVIPWLNPSISLSTVSYGKWHIIQRAASLREISPAIYMNGFLKDNINLANCEIRTVAGAMVIMERWYPRRHSFVIISNLSPHNQTRDLSTVYYGGEIIVDQSSRTGEYIKFNSLFMRGRETFIIKLDK